MQRDYLSSLRVKLGYVFVTSNFIISVNLCKHDRIQLKFVGLCIIFIIVVF
jgi:hypothetical protein